MEIQVWISPKRGVNRKCKKFNYRIPSLNLKQPGSESHVERNLNYGDEAAWQLAFLKATFITINSTTM